MKKIVAIIEKVADGEYGIYADGGITDVSRQNTVMTCPIFFLAFPFINASEFAKSIGINPSLMRKYKNGLVKAVPVERI
ncbi:hypothetical protein [Xylanibacter muris]|uniref:hypothetical protein n=1 Tax=Xylanibacter muris TaxID=2736290 RepID=UPI001C1323BA|nr:hypothetical protein [Xylanibacter muris]